MQSMEILQKLEGVDELGEARALCSVSIQMERSETQPEVISSAFTKDAVVSFYLTPSWVAVDLKFSEHLDFDLFQMVQVCKEYSERMRTDAGQQSDLILSICLKGEYEQFIIGRNGFWSLMAEGVEKYCDTIRFIFPKEQFGVYELAEEMVEQMVTEETEELDDASSIFHDIDV